MSDTPKLIVDSDWKNQAQAEKEKLAAKEAEAAKAKAAKAASTPGAMAGGPEGEMDEMPPADFQSLLGTMVTQALMYMGAFPDPQTGRAMVSLEHARLHIDLLAVLQEKTKGNLTVEEAEALNSVIGELRMRFVEIGHAVAKHLAERGGKPGAAGGAGGVVTPPGSTAGGGPKLVF